MSQENQPMFETRLKVKDELDEQLIENQGNGTKSPLKGDKQ